MCLHVYKYPMNLILSWTQITATLMRWTVLTLGIDSRVEASRGVWRDAAWKGIDPVHMRLIHLIIYPTRMCGRGALEAPSGGLGGAPRAILELFSRLQFFLKFFISCSSSLNSFQVITSYSSFKNLPFSFHFFKIRPNACDNYNKKDPLKPPITIFTNIFFIISNI